VADDHARLTAALSDRYRIERELGEGGMATVYLAEDLKHNRKVAIKVLKPELAAVLGAERFVQEIATTAALQHPNILPLFDSGSADGFLFYVMPYVEGETLRARLDRETQLGVDDSVQLIREVADALEYAHEHGVVHRDIKPENILIHAGRPMVADFGIALAVSAAAGGRMTETGLSLGTPHYMSPEQATAEKTITNRSDVYSLASVLYEMLTGDPPHTGKVAQQIIAKIIAEEPAPVTKVRKSVPGNVAAAVGKALEKLPADRFESAKTFADALANPAFRHGEEGVRRGGAASTGVSARRWKVASFALGTVAVLAITVAVWAWSHRQPTAAPAPPMLLASPLGPGDSLGVTRIDAVKNYGRPSRTAFAFLPDGRSLVYVGEGGRLMLRPLDRDSAMAIPGIEHAESPFVSPHGRWVGYWADGHLRRVPVVGGPSSDIATIRREITGASWSRDDRIAVGVQGAGIVLLSPYSGAPPDTIGPTTAVLPQFLPDGRSLVFTDLTAEFNGIATVDWIPVDGGKPQVLIRDAMDARYVPTGHLIFARHGVLMGVRFDAASHTVSGAPFTVLPDVMQALGATNSGAVTGAAQVAFSPLGQLAWVTGGTSPEPRREIVEYDRQGRPRVLDGAGVHTFISIRLSPSGDRLAITAFGQHSMLEVYDLQRGTAQIVPTTWTQVFTAWSPDGRRIFTEASDADSTFLVSLQADGTGTPRRIGAVHPLSEDEYPAFISSRDSTLYAFKASDHRLVGIDLDTGARHAVPNYPSGVVWPTLSPDGKWLAYGQVTPDTRQTEVYVSPWPKLDRRGQVSDSGGGEPAWTRDGRELIYVQLSSVQLSSTDTVGNRLYAVEMDHLPSGAPGRPHLLFTAFLGNTTPLRSYDVSADGSHFYTVRFLPTQAAPAHMYAMANWFSELRALSAQAEARK
jgi:Tol biopolymer transport system component